MSGIKEANNRMCQANKETSGRYSTIGVFVFLSTFDFPVTLDMLTSHPLALQAGQKVMSDKTVWKVIQFQVEFCSNRAHSKVLIGNSCAA